MSLVNIILVDDHTLFRNGLKILLNANKDFNVIAEASNGQEFLNLLDKVDCELVLMDIDMPVMNGIDATKLAIEKRPLLNIVALSMFGEEEYYYKMIEAGVKGFILKNSEFTEVQNAILSVMDGENYFSKELLYNTLKNIRTNKNLDENTTPLSDRELEILAEICKGLSNQEIADALFISKRTVDKHRANLLSKTQSKNTANLIMFAIKHKLIKV